jgi:hypothetical protein
VVFEPAGQVSFGLPPGDLCGVAGPFAEDLFGVPGCVEGLVDLRPGQPRLRGPLGQVQVQHLLARDLGDLLLLARILPLLRGGLLVRLGVGGLPAELVCLLLLRVVKGELAGHGVGAGVFVLSLLAGREVGLVGQPFGGVAPPCPRVGCLGGLMLGLAVAAVDPISTSTRRPEVAIPRTACAWALLSVLPAMTCSTSRAGTAGPPGRDLAASTIMLSRRRCASVAYRSTPGAL